jgi:hypothetical protein
MAYPFEKMTTRKLRSKLHEKCKRDRPHCEDFDRSEANPLKIKSRRSKPTHCKIDKTQSTR